MPRTLKITLAIMALVLLVASSGIAVLRSLTPSTNPYADRDIPAELEALVLKSSGLNQPGKVNGWTPLLEAMGIIGTIHENAIQTHSISEHSLDILLAVDIKTGMKVFADLSEIDQRQAQAALDILASEWLVEIDRLIDIASQADGFAPVDPYPTSMSAYMIPWAGQARAHARLQRARWLIAMHESKPEEARAHLRRSLVPAWALSGQISIIERLVATAIQSLGFEFAREQALVSDDTEHLKHLLDLVSSMQFPADVTHTLECERRLVIGDMVHLGATVGQGRSKRAPRMASKIDEGFDIAIQWAQAPRFQRTGLSPEQWAATINSPIDKVAAGLMPAVERFIHTEDVRVSQHGGTRILLAIRLYQLQQGYLPETLADLVPDYLEAVPDDPFSSDGFVYRPQPDPHTGAAFTLYSVGADGTDNGGLIHPEGNHQATRPQGAGHDVNFTQIP